MTKQPPPQHLYKLRSIELKGFKSISHAKVDFQPLTVVVGANSSGKSSLLQAILALSQTVRSGDQTGRFVLNGELIRLGTFEEVKNFASKDPDSPIQITTVIRTEHEVYEEVYDQDWPTLRHHSQISEDDDISRVYSTYVSWSLNLIPGGRSDYDTKIGSIEFKVSEASFSKAMRVPFDYSSTENRRSWDEPAIPFPREKSLSELPIQFPSKYESNPAVYEANLVVACYLSDIGPELRVSERTMFVPVPDEIKGVPLLKVSGQFTDWNPWWWLVGSPLSEPSYGGTGPFGDKIETYNCDAAVVIGGIPYIVYSKRSRISSYAYCWWDHATYVIDSIPKEKDELPAVDVTAVNYAEELIRMYNDRTEDNSMGSLHNPNNHLNNDLNHLGSFVKEEIGLLSDQDIERITDSMGQLGEAEFRRLLQERFKKEEWATEELLYESEQSESGLGKGLEGSVEVQDFFNKSIRYLGPLRAYPRSLHNISTNQLDIGINGEYVAAVLHTKADQEVLLPEVDGSSRHTDLISALDYWLQKFGMAESTHTEDWGRLGLSLKVSPPSMKESVDLTSVGVGVSQVLPVIVLCLLAEPGDLVILEQPELHLHPALQHKLADFLLECTRYGRQILVETHSEHLINRLRRRVAEDDSDETKSLVGLLFAEQYNGRTTFRESKINAYGGLSQDWPDGFLDLGAREAQRLVRSSVYKHRRRQNRDELLSDERKNGDEP